MNFSLRPHQLVAHWVPGFMFLLAVQIWYPSVYSEVLGRLPSDWAVLTLVWIVSAFALGQLLDSIRDLLEHCWDRWESVHWDFFFEGNRAKVDQLDDFYFTYYVFNANLVLALIAFFAVPIVFGRYIMAFATMVPVVPLAWDARLLRREIAKHTLSNDKGGT